MKRKFLPTINYFQPATFLCCRLGLLGFSTDLISRKTGLSQAQVYYRLKHAGIRRRDYRNGKSPIAKYVIQSTQRVTKRDLEHRLEPLQKRLTEGR